MAAERDDLRTSLTHIRDTATPRPEWSRCEGYVEDWAESSQGCSSDQLVDLLLTKISGKTLEEVTAHSAFQGQVVWGVVSVCVVWGGGEGMKWVLLFSCPGSGGGCSSLLTVGGACPQPQVLSDQSQYSH